MTLRHRLTSLAIGATTLLAIAPAAHAWPTAVWNTPTAKTEPGGSVHVGVYTYGNQTAAGTINTSGDDAVLLGLLPGWDVAGLSGVGGLEFGYDHLGTYGAWNGKLQLMDEGDLLPAVGVGTFMAMDTRGTAASENLMYGALTKEFKLGETSLGSWTVGGFTSNPSVVTSGNSGAMAGVSYSLTPALTFSADYLGGNTAESGTNVLLAYTVSPNSFVSVGRYFSAVNRDADMTFIAVDMDISTGLWSK